MAIYKNISGQKAYVFAWDISSQSAKTGHAASITAEISLDGGTSSATNDTNPTELDATDHPGIYVFDLTQAETNADAIAISAVSSDPDNVHIDPVLVYTLDQSELADTILDEPYSGAAVGTLRYSASLIPGIVTTLSGLVASIWSYASRTLTQSLVNAAELTNTGTVSFTRGDDEAPQVTVGQITGYQTIWVTAKTSYDDADTAAIIQWKSGTGLVRLNGATTTASWGEIVVESATTGLLTLRLDKEATVDLAPTNGSNLYLDVQIEDADGDIDTVAFGSVSVIADVTRATT